MSDLILFDEPSVRLALLPFTFTRPVADIRIGIQTIAEKWQSFLNQPVGYLTEPYLERKFGKTPSPNTLFVNGAICPTAHFVETVKNLSPGESLIDKNGLLLAIRPTKPIHSLAQLVDNQRLDSIYQYDQPLTVIRQLTDIFIHNGAEIRADFARLTANRTSQPITDPFTTCYAPEHIFLEPGAVVRASILNAEDGPIYIGRNAIVKEGSVVLGPFSLGDSSTVNWGSKMRNNTTIGPDCKVGGEVGNSVFFGHSNKSHDGFLGNSVIGEWCNFGAATNNSNLKNDYTSVKMHSYATGQLEDTGQLFCGLMMGDYTKTGIGTLFNTGTVVGVNVNVFGAGFQPKHIPSFSWGGAAEGFSPYRIEKALTVIRETMSRRNLPLTAVDEGILASVMSEEQRTKNG